MLTASFSRSWRLPLTNDELYPASAQRSSDSASSHAWKSHLEAAQRETDREKILASLYAAEEALTLRSQQLGQSPTSEAERAEIEQASAELLQLKMQKLGWKNPFA